MYYTEKQLIESGIIKDTQELNDLIYPTIDGGRESLPEDKRNWDVLYKNLTEGRNEDLFFTSKEEKLQYIEANK